MNNGNIKSTKSQYFTSGAISFSAMRNTFRLNNPTGTISASELLRNTDVTNTDPILPDATENSDVATALIGKHHKYEIVLSFIM